MSASLTGYGQALRIAIQDIYGIDAISGATLPKVNRKIEAANRPGLYEDILIRRSNIAYSVLDDYWNAAPVRPDPTRNSSCAPVSSTDSSLRSPFPMSASWKSSPTFP